MATAPVPQALVSPTPRSQTRTLASCSPRTLTNSTLALRGKCLCSSITGPISCSGTSSSGQGDWMTACGLPTSTNVNVKLRPAALQRLLDAVPLEAGELLAAETGDAHVHGDHVALAKLGHDGAGERLEDHRVARDGALHAQLARHHAHAVAAHLGLAAVRVEDADLEAVLAGRPAR